MLFPTLLVAFIAGAPVIPGANIDSAVDDRQVFQMLEAATTALAEKGEGFVKREARLEQCKRTRTDAFHLPSKQLTASPLDGAEIYRRAAQASVLIGSAYKCDKCTKWHTTLASGFAITADGVIATNHHVAAGATSEALGVLASDGRFFPVVEVLAADKAHDVALIRIDAKGLAFLPLRDDAPAGIPIRGYSHPAETFGYLSEGIITRYFKINDPVSNGAVFMQVTADYARGSSGGPILDSSGNAVGMISSTSPVYAAAPPAHAETKNSKQTAAPPSQQMVRHNCATARALLDLIRPQ